MNPLTILTIAGLSIAGFIVAVEIVWIIRAGRARRAIQKFWNRVHQHKKEDPS